MANLNLTINNLDSILTSEAGPIVAAIACQVITARTNAARPTDETMAAKSIRGMMRGDFQARLAKAMQVEEQQVMQLTNALARSAGDVLDALGASMGDGLERSRDESDEDYRARLEAANDLETKPIRLAMRTAADNLAAELLGSPGPVLDLLSATTSEMSKG
jgi:hypothetical protein